MQRNARPGTPAFFWQAVLILLPVVVLAVACWWSLQQDERIAEDDARKHAAENANSLAQTLRNSLNGEWLRYFELQQQWMAGMRGRLPARPGSSPGTFPDVRLQGDRQRWERDYPDLRLADVALPAGILLTNGQVVEPPDFPVAPRPPPWFRELSPKQMSRWEALRDEQDPRKRESLRQAFLATAPSSDAKTAAGMLVLPLDQWISPGAWAVPTETGITFGEIASYQLLTATNAALTELLLQSLQRCAVQHPSMMSAKLLELAERLTNNASPELRQEYAWLRTYAGRASMARECLGAFRSLPELASWKTNGWPHWTPDQTALAVFQPWTREQPADNGMDPLPQGAYEVGLMPRPVVAAMVRRVMEENRWLVPSYAAAEVVMEGVRVYDGGAGPAQAPLPFLAGAENGTGPALAPDAIRFQVNFGLASRPRLLAAAHRRAWIFGTLVLGAVLAALAGLLAASRAFRRQLQLNEQKSNFVSSVSHELRAPIASVRLMAENLERGKISGPERQTEYFRFIGQECRRLSSLIENVLDISRIEQGRKQYEFEPTHVVALVEATVKLMEPYATDKGVRLALQSGLAAPVELSLDGRAMQQALVNLIDNAVKHSPPGEVVIVGLENGVGNTLLLYVADHGPGIPAAEREKIFERFYRLGSELRRETQGAGIGLSVVKHIVEAHGGGIRVQSTVGQGSRFIIELPAR